MVSASRAARMYIYEFINVDATVSAISYSSHDMTGAYGLSIFLSNLGTLHVPSVGNQTKSI